MGTLIDRTGHRYGRLLVLSRDTAVGPASGGRRTQWLCQCDCGNQTSALGHELASGDTTSCGCRQREVVSTLKRSHGLAATPTYWSWQAAKARCYDKKSIHYAAYGGRGISMCDRWRDSFPNFLADMGQRPAGMTLDRINPNGDYEPANCRWATVAQQGSEHRRANVFWNGRETTIKAIAAAHGIPRTSLNKLIRRGLTIDAAITYAVTHAKP